MSRGARIAVGVSIAFVALWVVLAIAGRALSPRAEKAFIEALEKRFNSQAEVEDVQVRVFPWFHAEAVGLVFRHHGRTDVPPLIEADRITADTNPISLFLFNSVDEVRLEGLQIRVARKKDPTPEDADDESDDRRSGEGDKYVVQHIIADGTHLEILPKEEWKTPLTFDLIALELWDAGPDSPMDYDARLTNPKPPGEIVAEGGFGPWNDDDPGQSPVSGDYVFNDADLSHFNGIGGILSSEGSFEGVLERIAVEGWTDTPDFVVTSSNRPVHLKTQFSAVVDGTSGDTYLEPVIADFEQSRVYAWGKVAEERGLDGKSVILDVRVDKGRVEDMMKLAVPAEEAMLEGAIQYQAKFRLPPGEPEVPARLELDGRFGMTDAEFTKPEISKKLGDLSNRAQGEPEAPSEPVESDFSGDFRLRSGVLNLSDFRFQIPGATVTLGGDYGLLDKTLDFRGRVEMDAKISEATTGKKSFFLKLVDPFFKNRRKGTGSSIPIKISGDVNDPGVGLALSGDPKQ